MKKLSFFIVLSIIISMLNVGTSDAMAATTSKYGNSYGEQLTESLSAMFYESMVSAYIYKDGETGNPDGRYTNLPKRISGDGRITFDSDSNSDLLFYSYTSSDMETAQNAVNSWFESNYQTLLLHSSNAMHSFLRDYPQAFWIKGFTASSTLNISTTWTRSGGYTAKGYMKFELIPVKYVEPNDYYDEFVESVISLTSTFARQFADYDDAVKVKEIHDYIAERVDYNYAAAESSTKAYDYAYTPLAVFIDKSELGDQVVCQGYAKAFKIICDRLNIKNALLTGKAYSKDDSEEHMWNAVKINNLWYATDVTWDDQKGGIVYTYFLVGLNTVTRTDATYKTDHVAENVFAVVDGAKTFAIPEVSSKELNVGNLVKRFESTVNDNSSSTNDAKEDDSSSGKTVNISVVYGKSVAYTGSQVKSTLTIKLGNDTLVEGKDYKVTYKNNVNVGKASFTVTFIGEYKVAGSFTKYFEIKKRNISAVTVKNAKVKKVNFKKKQAKFSATFKDGSKKLKNGKDYTLTIKLDKKKKTVTVTLKGKGNYTGKKVIKIKVK